MVLFREVLTSRVTRTKPHPRSSTGVELQGEVLGQWFREALGQGREARGFPVPNFRR